MENYESYHTIKELTLGQTQVRVLIESIPTEEQQKKQLTKLYDVINDIAIKAEKRGVDTSKWFYSDKEIKRLKQNPENIFI